MKQQILKKLFLVLLLITYSVSGQNSTITGTILDETGGPLPGASIVIKGSKTGVSTDFDGKFQIQAKSTDILVISYIGYSTKEVSIAGKTTIDLNKAINQKKLIIFNLAKGKLGSKTSKIYGRFVLTTLLNIMLARADIPEEFRTPCHLYIDEFHNYISDSIQRYKDKV